MITLTLPYPISANRYWRSFAITRKGAKRASSVVTVSDEAKSFKAECGWLAKAAGLCSPLKGPVALTFRLVPKNRVCMDLDNALKVAIDAMKGVAYEDDNQVMKIAAERLPPDDKGARLEVEIIEAPLQGMPLFAEAAA